MYLRLSELDFEKLRGKKMAYSKYVSPQALYLAFNLYIHMENWLKRQLEKTKMFSMMKERHEVTSVSKTYCIPYQCIPEYQQH